MKAPLIHVAQMVFNTPLAIQVEKLEAILHAIGPRLVADQATLEELVRLHIIRSQPVLTRNAVLIAAQMDDDDERSKKPYKLTPEGIAIIPMNGTLMKRATWMSSASGLCSYQSLESAAVAALADPMVKAVLWDVDSPGGTTHGCFELSDALYGLRGDKPMWACANDLAASAAYALASTADRVFVTRTGGVGSVGVFALHCDMSSADEAAGVKFTYVYAGDKKIEGNPHEPLSKSAKADIQAEVDREYDMFVALVARNRGFAGANQGNVRKTQAAVAYGDNAVGLLADEVATLDEALEALTAKVTGSKLQSSGKLALRTQSVHNAPNGSVAAEPAGSMPDTSLQPASTPSKRDLAAMLEQAFLSGDQALHSKLLINLADDTGDVKGADMAKPCDEDMKKAKGSAEDVDAADPKDDEKDDDENEDDDEDQDDDEKKKDAKKAEARKSKKAAVKEMPMAAESAAKQIATLCKIAGAPELVADYISEGLTVDQVIAKLNERRTKASAEGGVNSYVTGGAPAAGGSQASIDEAIRQAGVISANSGGTITRSKAFEQLLRANPAIYEGYMEERDDVIARSPGGQGRALRDYVLNTQRRYMASLGLGTAIEDVPARRAM